MISQPSNLILACNVSAIPKELRPVHQANAERVFARTQEVRALETGYAWRLPNETDLLQNVVAFLRYERLCCPFFHFKLEIEPDQGPMWLHITGAIDVKEFLTQRRVCSTDQHFSFSKRMRRNDVEFSLRRGSHSLVESGFLCCDILDVRSLSVAPNPSTFSCDDETHPASCKLAAKRGHVLHGKRSPHTSITR